MSKDNVTFTINNTEVTVPRGTTVLKAAKDIGIEIPTLCYLKDINEIGACRMCITEVNGGKLQAACVYPANDGDVVLTNSPRVRKARKTNLELLLSDHNRECTMCVRSGNCELQQLSNDLGIREIPFEGEVSGREYDDKSISIVRDTSKCILCKRCIAVCGEVQACGAIGAIKRGFESTASPVFEESLDDVNCISCGQCIVNCPVAALREKSDIDRVFDAVADPDKYVVVQTAPSIRATIGEEFGYKMGKGATGQMVAALKRLGFDKVFDTDFGADVTIMEEATELIDRVTNGGVLPMLTSCSPGWINFLEMNYPEMIPNVSSCKSPQAMLGALIKTHFAEAHKLDPEKIVVVSVMPCTAKKQEVARKQLMEDNVPDVDISITTRELARMIREAGIDFAELPKEEFDTYYSESTGAAVIFGATGGVMEAAARTAVEMITGEDAPTIDYKAVRGTEGIKEAEIKAGDLTLKVAVAHSGANIKELIERIKRGETDYHFVEMMACPGGCVNGGGQPIVSNIVKMQTNVAAKRAEALYDEDAHVLEDRKSHENKAVKKMYDEYLGKPGGHKAHDILHTTYEGREKYKKTCDDC